MNDIAEQRPSFFEGEFLSAADLQQLLVYHRDQSARHLVGAHTWGVVAGLQILEQESSGALDVYLLPGYAVDGYGRAVIVVNPIRLSVDWFNGQPSGPVQVWIRYEQSETSAVRPGFQVCCTGGDAYSRIAESYAVEVGNLSLATRQSGISIAGEEVSDARTALRVFNDAGSLVCDGSVPYQDLPLADEAKSRWLIPLGQVGWTNGTPGKFVTLVDPANPYKEIYSRRLRRYAGVVAESVFAADKLIRLRQRTTEIAGLVDQTAIDGACAADDLTDESRDSAFDNCADGPTPNELVWVEGRLRVTSDVRILSPGRLELRDKLGMDYDPPTPNGRVPPTFLERTDRVVGKNTNADLAIVIGEATVGNNRLLIQQATAPVKAAPCQAVTFTPITRVAVLDSGNVGIGTEDPDELLTVTSADGKAFIHLRDEGTPSDLYLGADKFGGEIVTTNDSALRFRTGASDPAAEDDATHTYTRMTIISSGQVGIGTSAPDTGHQLTIEHEDNASLLIRTAETGGHEVILRANDDGALIAANTAGDDLLLGADGGKAFVWIKDNGRVGINNSAPGHDLGITNNGDKAEIALLATGGGASRRMVAGAEDNGVHAGSNTDHDFRLKTNDTTRVTIKTDGKVGIGTESPTHKLEVRGEIKLGNTGQYYAPGGFQNWAIIAGFIDESAGDQSGPGWDAEKLFPSNDWEITFTSSFSKKPIVTLTAMGSGGVVHPVITVLDPNQFRVSIDSGYSFNFIALAERT